MFHFIKEKKGGKWFNGKCDSAKKKGKKHGRELKEN